MTSCLFSHTQNNPLPALQKQENHLKRYRSSWIWPGGRWKNALYGFEWTWRQLASLYYTLLFLICERKRASPPRPELRFGQLHSACASKRRGAETPTIPIKANGHRPRRSSSIDPLFYFYFFQKNTLTSPGSRFLVQVRSNNLLASSQ